MAADVSTLVRIMSDYNSSSNKESAAGDLVTRDFLGCSAVTGSKELDLDLVVPSGFHRRLDLLSGETYLETSAGANVRRELHDLNLPPPQQNSDSSALDLKLLSHSASGANHYQSVCTLDKVRSALERAGRESQSRAGRQKSDGSASPATSSSSSMKRMRSTVDQEEAERGNDGSESSNAAEVGLIAAACPSCLMYVLIAKGNPRCPRCDSHVTAPAPMMIVSKKPRIDLNSL